MWDAIDREIPPPPATHQPELVLSCSIRFHRSSLLAIQFERTNKEDDSGKEGSRVAGCLVGPKSKDSARPAANTRSGVRMERQHRREGGKAVEAAQVRYRGREWMEEMRKGDPVRWLEDSHPIIYSFIHLKTQNGIRDERRKEEELLYTKGQEWSLCVCSVGIWQQVLSIQFNPNRDAIQF